MGRNYPNFIKAFTQHHTDNFVPNKFYLWAAVSVVAAALERKCWLPWNDSYSEYPNMYVFFVSRPGIGKSSAIRPAVNMLRALNIEHARHLRILPNKLTEPKLLDILGTTDNFEFNNQWIPHTSVYYSASEASACFQDPYGGFAQTVTALYDGDNITKATVSRNKPVEVVNPCFNLIAGCTFDYLSRLLTQEGVLGGFASRITYVVQDEVMERKSSWQGRKEVKDSQIDPGKLLADLADINAMAGPFTASEEFASAWEDWFPKFDKKQQEEKSEKLQSLMTRKQTAMRKLPMILCAAERDDRVLRINHWNMALKMMNEVESCIPVMIREGQSNQLTTQTGVNSYIEKILLERRDLSRDTLVGELVSKGFDPQNAENTVQSLVKSGKLKKDAHGMKLVGKLNG